jgi:choline transport protein
MICGIAALNHESYVIERWHIWLVFVAVTWCAVGLNVFGTRLIPMWNKFIRRPTHPQPVMHYSLTKSTVYFSVTTLVITMITILSCAAPNYQSAKFVFSDTTNSTGWPNDGLAFLFCIMNALYGFLGVDCGVSGGGGRNRRSELIFNRRIYAKRYPTRQSMSPRLL